MQHEDFEKKIDDSHSLEQLEQIRIALFSKTGYITQEMKCLGQLPPELKKEKGQQINLVKETLQFLLKQKKEQLEACVLEKKLQSEKIDMTLPGRMNKMGRKHPITWVSEWICDYFARLGFSIEQEREIENTYYNFDALNIPKHHPARQSHDTFYLTDDDLLLRTHTSNVQIRFMEKQKPPVRMVSLGRVYRSDYDATHMPMFHQVEGLVIDKDINMSHLKGILHAFLSDFFEGSKIYTRFRPSFFPFTEPSLEVDLSFDQEKWLEVLGSGMVHPKVLHHMNVDSSEYQGFAFGMGIERLAMIKFKIDDIRDFYA